MRGVMDRRSFLTRAALGATGLALARTSLMSERMQRVALELTGAGVADGPGPAVGFRQGTAGMTTGRVADFRPSTAGLHFANDFPHETSVEIALPGGFVIPIADAANGLCGGMVYAVRDLFQAGISPPPSTSPPGEGPGLRYLGDRLLDSLGLPLGPLTYLRLMNPAVPDGDVAGVSGRAWRTVGLEWPAIRDDLDRGILSPLAWSWLSPATRGTWAAITRCWPGAATWTVHS
jgi:hypothetical protein